MPGSSLRSANTYPGPPPRGPLLSGLQRLSKSPNSLDHQGAAGPAKPPRLIHTSLIHTHLGDSLSCKRLLYVRFEDRGPLKTGQRIHGQREGKDSLFCAGLRTGCSIQVTLSQPRIVLQ